MAAHASHAPVPVHVEQSAARRRWLIALALSLVAVAIAHLLDETAWRSLRDTRVNERDWGRFLRSMGYLPTWIAIAAALWLQDRPLPGWGWRGGAVLLAAAAGGIAAELFKLLFRRLRPDEAVFGYTFRSFAEDPISTRGLGMPSSHVMVAFAGATALARLFPRARFIGYLLAAGCALTRVLTVQHYLSDVVAAAALGWLVADPVARFMTARRELALAK
jgi:membrane-associated phospholipid phosphatase